MEPETGAAAKGKDSDDDQNAPDPSSLTGKTADQDLQILMDTGDANWYKSTQALNYIQPVLMPIVRDKMKSLQIQSMTDFGRQLCAEATADDIILVNGRLAQFKHLCPGTVVACQNLLNIIKGHTSESVNFYQMVKGTDPQQWLKSPFEFVRLFLKDWMRCDIHDFQECDITALCTIVKRCKTLMQIFDERKIDDLRKVRNRTMHPATMSISLQEMENNIDVILDFLEHIKSLKSTDEVTEAIESIKQLRTGDVRLLHSMVVRLIQGWLLSARIVYENKSEQAKNQLQDIKYMETMLARLSSGQDITSIKQSREHEFEVKKEDKRELENPNEELIKRLKEDKRELENPNEELIKRLNEEKRELEKKNEELSKRLKTQNKEKQELEKQNEELRKRLETNERRSFGEVCPTKEMSTQRSPDGALEVKEPPKRTASGGEPFFTMALPVCTSSGDEHETGKEEVSKRWSTYGNLTKRFSLPAMPCDEHETVKEVLSKQGSPYGSMRKIVSLPGILSYIPIRRTKDLSKQEPPSDFPKMTLSDSETLDGALEVEEPPKRTASGGQRFPMQALSASTGLGVTRKTVQKRLPILSGLIDSPSYAFRPLSGDEHETVKEVSPKRTASGGQRIPMQALSASNGLGDKGKTVEKRLPIWSWLDVLPFAGRPLSGDEHETVKKELSKPEPLYDPPRKTLSDLERLGDEHETVKEELSKQGSPYGILRKTVSLPDMLGYRLIRRMEDLSKQEPPSDFPKMTLSDSETLGASISTA